MKPIVKSSSRSGFSRLIFCCGGALKTKKDSDFSFLDENGKYREDPTLNLLKTKITRLMKQKPVKREVADQNLQTDIV